MDRFSSEDRRTVGVKLAEDVRVGLTGLPKSLPPKYFYDARGSALFDEICETPEYYLTRCEQTILDRVAGDLAASLRPTDLVELGSGAARKTRTLIEAALRVNGALRYVPLDVSASAMQESASLLLRDYPALTIHGLLCDFESLPELPRGVRRLIAFLGSTIGNLEDPAIQTLFQSLRRQMAPGDRLLVGFDLVKDDAILNAAYNDGAGVTAAFNRNVLHVVNRELDADFVPDEWQHVAFYDRGRARVEMHLKAPRSHAVRLRRLGLEVRFAAGETIHTEISRKFTRASARALLERAGLGLERWELSPDGWFALALVA